MRTYLRLGYSALICLSAIGCAADGENLISWDPASPNAKAKVNRPFHSLVNPRTTIEIPKPNSQMESASASTTDPGGNDLSGAKEALEPSRDTSESSEKPSSSPHDLVIDLPTGEDNDEEVQTVTPKTEDPDETLNSFKYDIPVTRNAAVDRWIEYFTGPGRKRFAYWLRRSGRYIDSFRQILKEKSLPQDLAYLPLIESGFTLMARSRAGAVGPWQFMPATARQRGLKITRYIDERRNPVKSTHAAADYLSSLYAEFGDWYLALAAYNSGENRVRRAIRRTGRKTYWGLSRTRYLPIETKNYVPKFLAGLMIAKHPEVFGFVGIDFMRPLPYEVVFLSRGMSLRHASKLAGISLREMSELNSELWRRFTPPVKGHPLRLPPGKSKMFLKRLSRAPREPYPDSGRYIIQSGDTFGSIAQRFGVPVRSILDLNAHLDPRRLKLGTKILLPIRNRYRPKNVVAAEKKRRGQKISINHTVVAGENIWLISQQYGVSPEDILLLNGLTDTSTIYPGHRLRIRR